jgi:tight adherence protein C
MLPVVLILVFLSTTVLLLAFTPLSKDDRPTLNIKDFAFDTTSPFDKPKEKKGAFGFLKTLALFNKPLIAPDMRHSLGQRLSISQTNMTPEEFFLFKEITIVAFLLVIPGFFGPEMLLFAIFISIAAGYFAPDLWLGSKVKKVKENIVKFLPDTVDLLGLCVNAGLDFMMALKWVVEKSTPNVVVNEMGSLLQEINVGKPRREALRDMARKYELPDLSTFSRTLIQADKMGTSVSEALNILSEDMRLARFRRGEAMAMKAPLKLLAPLLFCIFPVVGLLVGAPIFLDFMMNNPMKSIGVG